MTACEKPCLIIDEDCSHGQYVSPRSGPEKNNYCRVDDCFKLASVPSAILTPCEL